MPTIDTTPLPEAFVAGVSTGHIAHSVELIRQLYNAEIFANTVNVMSTEYGAVDGGSPATNTTALNNARADIVATGKPGAIYIPAGVDLPVTPDAVLGGSDVTYFGGGTLSTTQTTAGALITFPAGSTNFAVKGLRFVGGSDRIVAVFVTSDGGVSRAGVLEDNVCVECTLVLTNDHDEDTALAYADRDTDPVTGNVTRNIDCINNRGIRSAANLHTRAFILLWYTIGGTIEGNVADGYPYGIQWWGGDADQDIDGDLANERKAGDLTITANRMTNLLASDGGGAGIWGSMGKNVTVNGANVVDDCADVGIDFEGCESCLAEGNVVSNAVNGCLTAFFYNQDVHFGPNVCRQDVADRIMARVQNDHATEDNRGVTFDGGTWTCTDGTARVVCETGQRNIIRHVTMRNVRIDTEVNNNRNTTIRDNDMLFDEVLPLGTLGVTGGLQTPAINVGRNHLGGRAIVKGNTIESLVTQPTGARAIRSYQDDPDADVVEVIDDNILLGWTGTGVEPIETIWNGANAANTTTTFIRRNIIDPGATIVTTTGGSAAIPAVVVMEDNYEADGTAHP